MECSITHILESISNFVSRDETKGLEGALAKYCSSIIYLLLTKFFFVLSEEKQRQVSQMILPPLDSTVTLSKTMPNNQAPGRSFARKEWPICSHYGIVGHVVDKCYKIHG